MAASTLASPGRWVPTLDCRWLWGERPATGPGGESGPQGWGCHRAGGWRRGDRLPWVGAEALGAAAAFVGGDSAPVPDPRLEWTGGCGVWMGALVRVGASAGLTPRVRLWFEGRWRALTFCAGPSWFLRRLGLQPSSTAAQAGPVWGLSRPPSFCAAARGRRSTTGRRTWGAERGGVWKELWSQLCQGSKRGHARY